MNLAEGPRTVKGEATVAGVLALAGGDAILTPMSERDRERANGEGSESDADRQEEPLYFFPDREVTASELEALLAEGGTSERAEAISCLLRYAEWGHIWRFVSREEVREIFPELDLPERLRQAWARMLGIEVHLAETD